MAEAASAAAAAAKACSSRQSTLGPSDGAKLSLYPHDSAPVTRASSLRFVVPSRPLELGSIHEEGFKTIPLTTTAERPAPIIRCHSANVPTRPTIGVARSASMNLGRRGSQSYLRRTQSLYGPGDAVYRELPFHLEEKQAFLPASSRAGNTTIRPMLRTLRDPDALGTRKVAGYVRKFSFSMRPTTWYDDAKRLGRRVSQRFRRNIWGETVPKYSLKRIQSDTVRFNYPAPDAASEFSFVGDSPYADTIIHNRTWENQNYLPNMNPQGSDYFGQSPARDTHSNVTSIPIQLKNPIPISIEGLGHASSHLPLVNSIVIEQHDTSLEQKDADPRPAYGAFVRNLTKRFVTEPPPQTPSPEASRIEESYNSRRVSNENAKPSKISLDMGSASRPPLSEIPAIRSNSLVIDAEGQKDIGGDQRLPQTELKRMRSDELLFSQIGHPHHVWQDEVTNSEIGETSLTLQRFDSSQANLTVYSGISASNSPAKMVTNLASDKVLLGTRDNTYRQASGKWQENNKTTDRKESGMGGDSPKPEQQNLDPVFL